MDGKFLNAENAVEILKSDWLRRIPFLPSEEVQILDKTTNGCICLTNFRLIFYVKHLSDTTSVPVKVLRSAELSSPVHMYISTKTGTSFTYVISAFFSLKL